MYIKISVCGFNEKITTNDDVSVMDGFTVTQ